MSVKINKEVLKRADQKQKMQEEETNAQIVQQNQDAGLKTVRVAVSANTIFSEEYDEKIVKGQLTDAIGEQYSNVFRDRTLSDSDKDKRKKKAVKKLSAQQKLKRNIARAEDLMQAKQSVEEMNTEALMTIIDNLNVEKFGYSSDSDFIKNYAANFSKLDQAKRICDKIWEEVADIPEIIVAKRDVINELHEEYTRRKELLSSPYYILLANRDFKELLSDEGEDDLNAIKDEGILDYIRKYHRLRESKVGKKKSIRTFLREREATAGEAARNHKEYKDAVKDLDLELKRNGIGQEQEEEKEDREKIEQDRIEKEPQMKAQREAGEEEIRGKLAEDGDISGDYRVKALATRERLLAENEKYLNKYTRLKQDCKDGKILPEDNDYYTQERFDEIIAEKRQDVANSRKWRDQIKEYNEGGEVPLIITKDRYYLDSMEEHPETAPLFPEGQKLTVSPHIKQGLNTCYFMSVIYGLIESGHEDYIKNTMIREYGNDGTQAVVRLFDAEGLPVDIVVTKTRMQHDPGSIKDGVLRDMWLIVLEKAVQVLMCKSSFKTVNADAIASYGQGGGITKNVDYKALSEKSKAGEDFCEDHALSKFFMSKSSEPVGIQMILGKSCIRYDNRNGVSKENARFSEAGNKNIGRMKELLARGKCVIGSTAQRTETTFWADRRKENRANHDNRIDPEHILCFKSVDEETQTIKAADSIKGGEVQMTFEEFRTLIMDIYVTDLP